MCQPQIAWGEILGDTTVAAAMLDRLLHRSVVINLDGDSYRLRDHIIGSTIIARQRVSVAAFERMSDFCRTRCLPSEHDYITARSRPHAEDWELRTSRLPGALH
jgi:IstB-like ATP binding protein